MYLVDNEKFFESSSDYTILTSDAIITSVLSRNSNIETSVYISESSDSLNISAFVNVSYLNKDLSYRIPVEENAAFEMIALSPNVHLSKTCLIISDPLYGFKIIVYSGLNKGLILAEPLDKHTKLPDWIGEDVSQNERYSEANLAIYPYSLW